jgi:hypothetical protein
VALRSGDMAGATAPEPPRRGRKGQAGGAAAGGLATGGGTNQIDTVLLTCRSVNLKSVRPDAPADAHTLIAEGLAEELRSRTNHFLVEGTKVFGDIVPPDTNLTFTFQVTLKLARPVKL